MPYEVEVRVTARYFVECDEEVCHDEESAMAYAETLGEYDVLDAPNYEVDKIEILDACEF